MKCHQFIGNGARRPAHKRPAIAEPQSEAVNYVGWLRGAVAHSEQVPNRMPTEVIVFLNIGERTGEDTALRGAQMSVMEEPPFPE